MILSRNSLLLTLSIALSNCGNKSPLTAEQKAQLKATLNSTATGLNVSNGQKTQRTKTAARARSESAVKSNAARGLFLKLAKPKSNSSESIDIESDDQFQTMSERLDQCEVNYDDSSNKARAGVNPMKQNVKLKIDGKQCPIVMSSSILIDGEETSAGSGEATIKVTANYSVVDDSFRKLNDVDSLKFNFEAKVSESEKSMKVSMKFDGSVNSQSQGSVSIAGDGKFSGNQEKVDGNLNLEFKFKDFAAELNMKMVEGKDGEDPTIEYTLNGEKMTEEQVQEFFGQAFEATEEYQGSVDQLDFN